MIIVIAKGMGRVISDFGVIGWVIVGVFLSALLLLKLDIHKR